MNSVFSEELLAEKLSKINSTQLCIETLSHWCIFHRNKAEVVVATWDKQFHNLKMAQKVPLLYVANDILQNSKRNGNEFVAEFWKVLPAALKEVLHEGDDRGKNVVSRLVDIWEERRVFGSRARGLKEVMLGEEALPPLEFNSNKKRSRSIKIMKRDSRSMRTKLAIGGVAEKIVSAFHLVLSEQQNEASEKSKCNSAVNHIRKLEKDVNIACSTAKDPKRKTFSKELEEEENVLKQCVEKLKLVEANRLALISQLKEALHEQESELENVRTQLQVAQVQGEEARNMRKRLENEDYVSKSSFSIASTLYSDAKSSNKSAAAIAAEVADRLTASTSSQLIMTSVLSTFAAQEAKSAGLTKATPTLSPDTTKPLPVTEPNTVFITPQPPPPPPQLATNHSYQSVLVAQNQAVSNSQVQYHLLGNPASQQYIAANPYGYNPMPPPPPPPPHMVSPMGRLTQQPLQMPQQQQQQPIVPSFQPLQPPGMVYYGRIHHSQ